MNIAETKISRDIYSKLAIDVRLYQEIVLKPICLLLLLLCAPLVFTLQEEIYLENQNEKKKTILLNSLTILFIALNRQLTDPILSTD